MSRRHPGRFVRGRRFLQARLSPEGYLGLHLTIGLLSIVLACWAFGEIAQDFSSGFFASVDRSAAETSRSIVTPRLTSVVKSVTFLGSVPMLTIISFIVAIVLALKRALFRLSAFALTMTGGSALNIALKHLFERQRPALEDPLVTLASYGFPSGHTMGTTLLFGSIAIILTSSAKSFGTRAFWFVLAAVWVLIIGATRIYLGAHYFTDVIGAISAGTAWLALCWTAVETLRRWRLRQQYKPLSGEGT
ncbi:phosphatase PAP2 family protein [soil metagenome]